MSYSFIGGSFLSPYTTRFEQAVNLAATHHDDEYPEVVSITPTQQPKKLYSLVRTRNVGYTAILLFARDPTQLHDIQEAEVGFGAAEMGNKGAVGLRATYHAADQKSCTEVTFVATHLAAMEWNLPRRNANWAAIMRALTFEDPEALLKSYQGTGANPNGVSDESEESSEQTPLLHDQQHEQHARLQQQLHELSVFKPSSHLFVAGDLNYRISTTSPPPNAPFPSLDPTNEYYYPRFLPLDQLTRERLAGRTMHGLTEAPIRFPPTYKYMIQGDSKSDELKWKFASHRYPSWTDRVLYLDLPPWITSKRGAPSINVLAYNSLPIIRSSDHRPVYFRATVPLLPPITMRPPPDAVALSDEAGVDPRMRLPVEIDPEAWGHRAAARQREVMLGWGTYLWSTRQGALILAFVVASGLIGYWVWRSP